MTKNKRKFDLDESDKGFVNAKSKGATPAPLVEQVKAEMHFDREVEPECIRIALKDLAPSPFNPRKSFDKVKLAELVADVSVRGVLQPLLVRRTGLDDGTGKMPKTDFEIIFGHCRFEAAKQAGLKTVPCLVRIASDAEALELQLVENLKRTDLDHFELAEGYARLRDHHGFDPQQIALKVGRSYVSICEALKLTELNTDVRIGLQKSGLGSAHALLLARLPEAAREKVLNTFIAGHLNRPGPMNVKDARGYVAEYWMADLRGAPFKLDDEKLCPEAGSCKACPKRSGNMGSAQDVVAGEHLPKRLDSGGRAPAAGQNVCFDTACHRQKLVAHAKLEAAKRGITVLSESASDEVFSENGHLVSDRYVDAGDQDFDDVKARQHKELLDAAGLKKQLVLGITKTGELKELLIAGGLEAAKRDAGKKVSERERLRAKAKPRQSKEAKAKEAAENAFREQVVAAAVNTIVIQAGNKFALNDKVAEFVRACLVELAYRTEPVHLMERRQIKGDGHQVMKRAQQVEMSGLLLELAFGPELTELPPAGGYSRALVEAAKLVGVDLKKVEKDVKAAGKAAA